MDAVEYIKQHIRICNAVYDCDDCPLHGKCAINGGRLLRDDKDIIASVATVEQWALEHPLMTRRIKLKKQYPKLNDDAKYDICAEHLGYECKDCEHTDCKDCWDMPVEEGQE